MQFERAIILGASGGIGAALAETAPARSVLGLSRRGTGLEITDEASVAAAAAEAGPADLIIDATGILETDGVAPEKSFSRIDPAVMMRQFEVNALGTALILKHFMPLLPREAPGVIATLSARVGSIGDNRLGGWVSYRAAKAAQNQILHTGAIELARTHRQAVAVAIHPGTVATALTAKYAKGHKTVEPPQAARNIWAVIAGLDPTQTGKFFDWSGAEVVW